MSDATEEYAVVNPFRANAAQTPTVTQNALVSVAQQRSVAEIQARMIIARSNPRDPIKAMDLIIQDCTRTSLAETALYHYARGGANVSGISIRLAEVMAARWGNVSCGVHELSRDSDYSTCKAYAWDLETGFYDEKEFQVRHWVDTKAGGYKIRDERSIYELVANMGARRKRSCILAIIPGDVQETAVSQVEQTLKATADTSPEAVKLILARFADLGVNREMLEGRIQRRIESIHPAQVVLLRKIFTSLKDEMSSVEDWFDAALGAKPTDGTPALTGGAALKAKLDATMKAPEVEALKAKLTGERPVDKPAEKQEAVSPPPAAEATKEPATGPERQPEGPASTITSESAKAEAQLQPEDRQQADRLIQALSASDNEARAENILGVKMNEVWMARILKDHSALHEEIMAAHPKNRLKR